MKLITNRPKFYFKWVKRSGTATHAYGFSFSKFLPKNGQPGPWLPKVVGRPVLCRNGYHLARPRNITHWHGDGYRLFLVQVKGPVYDGGNKVVCRQFRFLKEIKVERTRSSYGYTYYSGQNALRDIARAGVKIKTTTLPNRLLKDTYKKYRKR